MAAVWRQVLDNKITRFDGNITEKSRKTVEFYRYFDMSYLGFCKVTVTILSKKRFLTKIILFDL